MLIYVAYDCTGIKRSLEKAKKITHDLQVKGLANCYICPLLTFSHLKCDEIGQDNELELRFDVLQNCDKIIIANEITEVVRMEIKFANLLKLEVIKLGEDGTLRPFKE